MKKSFLILIQFLTFTFSIFSFDWPQKEIASDSFFTYFGQFRGGLLSPSLVFTGTQEINAASSGYVTLVLSEHDEETQMFESTLGNALFVSHKNELLTVYGNLSSENIENLYELKEVNEGDFISVAGISGWQEGSGLLEFQVVDCISKSFVNPRVLFPRFGNEQAINFSTVYAVDKNGKTYNLNNQKYIPANSYLIYRDRQNQAMPYKTSILVNGAIESSVSYDSLVSKDGVLSTAGNKNYSSKIVYPDENKHLLGEISLSKGKNKITIVLTDLLGKENSKTFNIESW